MSGRHWKLAMAYNENFEMSYVRLDTTLFVYHGKLMNWLDRF